MNKKLSLYAFVFMCMLFIVTAAGNSRVPNNVLGVGQCKGDIWIKVYPGVNSTYEFLNCTLNNQSTNVWQCPCMSNLYLQIPNGTSNSFSFTAQYYTDTLLRGNTSDVYTHNDQLKQVIQVNDYIINDRSDEEVQEEKRVIKEQTDAASSFIFKFIGVFFLLVLLGIIILVMLSKLRKKYNLGDDEKLTIKMILSKVFSRPDIQRKSIGDLIGRKQKVEQPVLQKKIEPIKEDTSNIKSEAQRILESINK